MEWIKCNERMPDFDTDVLVTDGKDCYVAYRVQIGKIEYFEPTIPPLYISHSNPICWMPLPKPPNLNSSDT